ncbi:MAG: hypothetical protein HY275_10030, partial [Gemmatimonadetes bacterium]|nr:hypothetical protein [Gemmatimonadota bacterium]
IRGIESSDGQSLFFTKPDTSGLWSLDFATQAERIVVPDVLAGDWTNWVVAAGNVYFVDRDRSGAQRVVAYALANGARRELAKGVKTPVGTGGIASSADGERVVFAQLLRTDATLFRLVPR